MHALAHLLLSRLPTCPPAWHCSRLDLLTAGGSTRGGLMNSPGRVALWTCTHRYSPWAAGLLQRPWADGSTSGNKTGTIVTPLLHVVVRLRCRNAQNESGDQSRYNNTRLFWGFPYVCPEPVLVMIIFMYKWRKGRVCLPNQCASRCSRATWGGAWSVLRERERERGHGRQQQDCGDC